MYIVKFTEGGYLTDNFLADTLSEAEEIVHRRTGGLEM